MIKKICIIGLVLTLIASFCLGAKSCTGRNNKKTKTGSSTVSTFMINAPSNLIATATSISEIQLTWQDNSNNEDGFEIESREGGTGAYTQIATVGYDVVSYSDTGLTADITYYYRVRAFMNNAWQDKSDYSNEISATTFSLPPPVIEPPSAWSQIAAGMNHSVAIGTNDTVWSWGYNYYGELGVGDFQNRSLPTLIINDWSYDIFDSLDTISAGGGDNNGMYFLGHNLSLKTNGTLWAWGANANGELGLGDNEIRNAPAQVGLYDSDGILISADSDWGTFTVGAFHTIALKLDGTIWAWGFNRFGELGLGDSRISRNTPTQIGTESDWSLIIAGSEHNIARKTNGTIWSWGNGIALGLGDWVDRNTPTMIGNDSDWSSIEAGENHSLAIKSNGSLWAWGANQGGLGDGTIAARYTPRQIGTDSDWSLIKGGGTQTIVLKTNSTLWAWGLNSYGQLGLGDNNDRRTPTQIGTDSDWSIVECGRYHSIALKTDGSIWAWGYNSDGQLGLGDVGIHRNTPTLIRFGLPEPPANLIAYDVSSTEITLTWVDISYNETGFKIERKIGRTGNWLEINTVDLDITTYSDITASGFTPNTTYYYRLRAYNALYDSIYSNEAVIAVAGYWSAVAAGQLHTIALRTNGSLWSWGKNDTGQLGLGDYNSRNTPSQIGSDTDWVKGTAGTSHTLAIKTDMTLWAWGVNWCGQLGDGTVTTRITPRQIGTNSDWSIITAGPLWYSIGRKTTGTLWSWGYNGDGELGLGDKTERHTPTQIGSETGWSLIVAGGAHAIACKLDDTIWSWGNNTFGQLGLGGSEFGPAITTPTQIGLDTDWSGIALGYEYSLGIKFNRTIWTWGDNQYGQLGLGDTDNIRRMTPTQVGTETDWLKIASGYYHAIGLKTNGDIWVWGQNDNGQLGLGDSGNVTGRIVPTQIENATNWSAVTGGISHTIAIKTNGTLWIWGDNQNGQLGLGDAINRNVPTLVGE
jgi:alpha-tubulin suppressor-like RCC1 family protein